MAEKTNINPSAPPAEYSNVDQANKVLTNIEEKSAKDVPSIEVHKDFLHSSWFQLGAVAVVIMTILVIFYSQKSKKSVSFQTWTRPNTSPRHWIM